MAHLGRVPHQVDRLGSPHSPPSNRSAATCCTTTRAPLWISPPPPHQVCQDKASLPYNINSLFLSFSSLVTMSPSKNLLNPSLHSSFSSWGSWVPGGADIGPIIPLSPLRLAASKTDLASPLRIVKLLPALRLISCSVAGGARGPFGGEVYSPPRLFAHGGPYLPICIVGGCLFPLGGRAFAHARLPCARMCVELF